MEIMEIDIDIDDIIMSCSKREKKDLYKALLEDGDVLSEKEKIHWLYGHYHHSWHAEIDGIHYTMLKTFEMKELR